MKLLNKSIKHLFINLSLKTCMIINDCIEIFEVNKLIDF